LIVYIDSDWVGDHDDSRSTLGFVYFLGSSSIVCLRKMLSVIALSSTEAKYRGVVIVVEEAIWFRHYWMSLGLNCNN
jgi:hypothetical protein